jgi:hypothetical protein
MKITLSRIRNIFISLAFSLGISLITTQASALQLSPVQVTPGVYAFIGETGMRTYENEGMNATPALL